ncbi:MAG: VOC family protein [Microbacterium sp.]|uniref:VOC family protein n=1 Tax=Microbacterium sp. TaxID=51671 RepID=UPI0039E2D05F
MTELDHVGLSVGDLDAQSVWYAQALGLTALPPLANPALGVRTQYLVDADGWALELLERAGSAPGLQATSPSDAILTRGYGHICLRVADVDAAYGRLLDAGAAPIAPPGASPMSGLRLAFVADPEGNLIELLARPEPLA